MNKKLAKRYAAETRFKLLGLISVSVGLVFLLILLFTIFKTGYTAFYSTQVLLELDLEKYQNKSVDEIKPRLVKNDLSLALKKAISNDLTRNQIKKISKLILSQQSQQELKNYILENKNNLKDDSTIWFRSSSFLDQISKGNIELQNEAQISAIGSSNINYINKLILDKKVKTKFNFRFVTKGDSRYPELAGIAGAVLGSFYTLIVCFLISFPVAVAAAIYLEEFAPKNKFTSFIEININNLAAVPSIIYGLLGLVVVLGFFGVPRSTPLAGGIVLALRTLPTIIIASRAAIRSVPSTIRQAALAIGASKMQVVLHHVLPLSLPGTLTGSIIGLSQALGETAPLLLIGMVAFVVDLPSTPLDPSTTLPVQIYLWAESSERGFVEKTSAAIMIILSFLMTMNSFAILMRKKYERRW